MRLRFTKMHGAGNDFVVLDGTRAPLALTPAQLQRLGDRRFGVGADQILLVEPAPRRASTSLPHLQRQRRRGRTLRQRRALLRALTCTSAA
jgi:diaminopimelate epimerase